MKQITGGVTAAQGFTAASCEANIKYKDRTEQVLTENPYRLVEDVDGIGFKTADKIAMKLGIKFDSEKRIRAGVLFYLTELAEKQGSTVCYLEDLKFQTLQILELDENIRAQAQKMVDEMLIKE